MSRLEKISFIRSFWTYKEVYENLESYPDNKLDSIITAIVDEIRRQVNFTAIDHVLNFPVYLN